MRTLAGIRDHFPRSPDDGLSDADAADSRARFGANRLTPLPREPAWRKFLAKFDDAIIKILLAASLLKVVVDLFGASPLAGGVGLFAVVAVVSALVLFKLGDWLPTALFVLAAALVAASVALGAPSWEGLAVMLAVALATGVAFLSEYRSDREFEVLNERKEAGRVKVLRGGLRTVPLEDVVVGDLVVLEAGDEVPADGRAVRANELMLDQSLLTGESEAVRKDIAGEADATDAPDQPGCLFRGTQVVDGAGRMVVTNVGDDTMLGQIARRLSDPSGEDGDAGTAEGRVRRKLSLSKALTPLQEKLEALAGLISKVGYAAAAAIFVALLVRGVATHEVRFAPHFVVDAAGEYVRDAAGKPTADPARGTLETPRQTTLAVVDAVLGYFVYMVIVVVVAVPEGLPMSVTVSLALAMRKMTRVNALVRQLVACETIGSATVICSDKTGTLTRNKMRVERVGRGTGMADTSPAAAAGGWLALNAAANATASVEAKDGKPVVVGNSTEGALLFWLGDAGVDVPGVRAKHPPLFRAAFSSVRKTMTTVVRADGGPGVLVKGAPEVVLAHCTRVAGPAGAVELTADARRLIEANLAAASADAMRTLAFAHAELPADFPADEAGIAARRHEFAGGLTFDGFVAIRDPLRDDVPAAVRSCHAAGIEVKMITGDNVETARAVARDAGLLDRPGALVLTSDEFERLSDDELKAKLPDLRVLARAKPLDKFRLVRLLQSQDHVVAMTGDGTNDAPSLKAADVGLAMGISGTEVAKEASQIVLLDDSFGTIVKAVHWGRALYENIQRFIQFQLTINVSALTIAFLGPFLGLRPPFTVLQLLWINVIMDTFAAIALCSEPPRAGLMRVPPKGRHDSILTPAMLGNVFATAAFFVVAMITLLVGMQHDGWYAGGEARSAEFPELTYRQVTVFFTVYVFFQVWNQINCRSLTPRESGLRRLFANPQFLAVASLTVLGQVLIVTFGGRVFNVEPLAAADWLGIAAATASVLLFAEVSRRLRVAFGRG